MNDKILNINDAQFDCITDMVLKQNKLKKEQFATMLCKTVVDEHGFEVIVADSFDEWPSENLEQTEVSVEPKSWDWLNYNLLEKNKSFDYHISTVVSLHTHPDWFGTERELDSDDTHTFKIWTQAYRDAGIDMINGIVSSNGYLKLYRYNADTDSFDNVICQVGEEFVNSTLPDNVKGFSK